MNVENMIVLALTLGRKANVLRVWDFDGRNGIEREFALDRLDTADLLTRAMQFAAFQDVSLSYAMTTALWDDPSFLDNAVEQP